jgi:ketosteroid isomerase-like protein
VDQALHQREQVRDPDVGPHGTSVLRTAEQHLDRTLHLGARRDRCGADSFECIGSRGAGGPYRFRALGVIRVRDGEIVSYDDYMDPIALAALLGRTPDLVSALTSA